MTTQEIHDKLLTDDMFLLLEVDKICTYYQLKHTLRWDQKYTGIDVRESVAEHVYGMHILTDYFLPFYPGLDEAKVHNLISWHDMAEALVGDMTTMSKTESHKQAEFKAEQELIAHAPEHLAEKLRTLFDEYNTQTTKEAQFVKAIDKVEPFVHIYFLSKTTTFEPDFLRKELSDDILRSYQENRRKYLVDFPMFLRLDEVLLPAILETNYIHPEAW